MSNNAEERNVLTTSPKPLWSNVIEAAQASQSPCSTLTELTQIITSLQFKKISTAQNEHEGFYSALVALCSIKICSEVDKYSLEELNELRPKCEYLLEYLVELVASSGTKSVSLSNSQIARLFESFIRSKCVCNDSNDLIGFLKNCPVPPDTQPSDEPLRKSTGSNIILTDLLSNQFKPRSKGSLFYPSSSQPPKAAEFFSKANLKYLIRINALGNFIRFYLKSHMPLLTDFKTKYFDKAPLNVDVPAEVKENIAAISNEISHLENLMQIKGAFVDNLADEHVAEILDYIQCLFLISVQLSTSGDVSISLSQKMNVDDSTVTNNAESSFVSSTIKMYNQFYNVIKLSEKHQRTPLVANVNAKCAHYLVQIIQRSMVDKTKRQLSRTIGYDSARLCIKFIEMFKILVEETCTSGEIGEKEPENENFNVGQIQLSYAYKAIERLRFFKALDVYKTLWCLFDIAFKKCELIYVMHKHEEDTKLSHANLETHNKQQQLESASNQTASTEIDNNNDSDNIKDIDESSDDSDYMLAPWFDEPNEVANTTANTTQLSSNSTQILDTTFELDSNHSYSQLIDLMIEILSGFEMLITEIKHNEAIEDIRTSIQEKEIKDLATVINEIETKSEHMPERFINSFIKYFQIIVFNEILDYNKQNILLASLGLNTTSSGEGRTEWPLFVNQYSLTVLFQIFVIRLNKLNEMNISSDTSNNCYEAKLNNEIAFIWNSFLTSLHTSIIKREHASLNTDVNVEHMQVLLFLYHQIGVDHRNSILRLISENVIECSESIEILSNYAPLLLSRLIALFDYMVRNYDGATSEFLEQLKSTLELSSSKSLKSKRHQHQLDNTVINVNSLKSMSFIESLEYFYQQQSSVQSVQNDTTNESASSKDLQPPCTNFKPRFYTINRNTVLVNPIAIKSIQSIYPKIYKSLVKMLNTGSSATSAESIKNLVFTLEDTISVSYLNYYIWNLLGALEPTLDYLGEHVTPSGELKTHAMTNIEMGHLMRLCTLESDNEAIKPLLTSMRNSLLNPSEPNATIAYFIQLWSQNLTENGINPHEIDTTSLCSAHQIDVPANELIANLDLFTYHTKLLTQYLNTKEASQIDANQMTSLTKVLAIYTHLYKWHFKRHIILTRFNDETEPGKKLDSTYLDTLSSILSVTCNSNLASSRIAKCLVELGQHLPSGLEKYLKKQLNDAEVTQTRASEPNELFYTNLKYRWSHLDFNIKSLLVELVQLIRTCANMVKNSPAIDSSLIQLYCDYICHPVVASHVSDLFEDDAHLAKISALTHTAIYHLCINSDTEQCDSILLELLRYLESSLETPHGLKAFCAVYHHPAKSSDGYKLLNLLVSTSKSSSGIGYFTQVISIVNKIFQVSENKQRDDEGARLSAILTQLNKIADYDSEYLQRWLSKLVMPTPSAKAAIDPAKCKIALQQFTMHLVADKNISEVVTLSILSALIQLASKLINTNGGIGFAELIILMDTLSGAGSGLGHFYVFQACCIWLEYYCTLHLDKMITQFPATSTSSSSSSSSTTSESKESNSNYLIESACYLLAYVSHILSVFNIKPTNETQSSDTASSGAEFDFYSNEFSNESASNNTGSNSYSNDIAQLTYYYYYLLQNNALSDAIANSTDADNESNECKSSDEAQVDSVEMDADPDLNNKLCTFTVTKKEFANQHWYYCHTCKMVERIGVCSICAQVCHRGHDVTYAKFGSFFCDCGAKEDNSCIAMKKREETTSSTSTASTNPSKQSDGTKTPRNDLFDIHKLDSLKASKQAQLEKLRTQIFECVSSKELMRTIKQLISSLMPIAEQRYASTLLDTRSMHARQTLTSCATSDKAIESSDGLFIATLGSQEGAFENVRMTFAGDQGAQIKSLMNSHALRRVSMCCLASSVTKQHLIVTQEKGKSSSFTVLQLNALLRQDSNKRNKLTLTKLSTVQVPFTLISVVANCSNEDYVALVGLKDCHIMYLNENGQTYQEALSNQNAATTAVTNNGLITLVPSLDANNYIIRAIWLPGSQCELALVTSDWVKVYDLSKDTLSPAYFFMLPTGKIRDCTFMINDADRRHIVIMSSLGHMYVEALSEQSAAKHGLYYLTSTIEWSHSSVDATSSDDASSVCGGGVSVYYSHKLRLLFFSLSQGKTFAGSLNTNYSQIERLYHLNVANQALCHWSEIASHPGLILAMTQHSNNPVAIVITPERILYQEIKFAASKSKIQDMVATRHPVDSTGLQKTTMIILCDDGSLKIYVASAEKTEYWLQAPLTPLDPLIELKNASKRTVTEIKPTESNDETSAKTPSSTTQLKFPVDFLEKCTLQSDIEFGGNDVLEVYNSAQIKSRLALSKYIANTKSGGFSIEMCLRGDNRHVILGARVLVGKTSLDKCPSFIEVAVSGRRIVIATPLQRERWIDICLSRDEAYASENKLVLFIGATRDHSRCTMIDSIKVYTRTREQFAWRDDEWQRAKRRCKDTLKVTETTQPISDASSTPKNPISAENKLNETKNNKRCIAISDSYTQFDRLLAHSLDILDNCLSVGGEGDECERAYAFKTAFRLLSLVSPAVVAAKSKNLLVGAAYGQCKDEARLSLVSASMRQPQSAFDFEALQKVLLMCTGGHVVRVDAEMMITRLSSLFWHLVATQRPLSPAVASIGFSACVDLEVIVESLVEIIHVYSQQDASAAQMAINAYVSLLVSNHMEISFTCKRLLLSLLKPKRRKTGKSGIETTPKVASEKKASESLSQISSQTLTGAGDAHVNVQVDDEILFALDEPHSLISQPIDVDVDVDADVDDELMADDEMMQLAMVLSMNEAAVVPTPATTAPLPTATHQESSNDQSGSEDDDLSQQRTNTTSNNTAAASANTTPTAATKEATKQSTEGHQPVTKAKSNDSESQQSTDDHQPQSNQSHNQQQLDSYGKLNTIRKMLLETLSERVQSDTFAHLTSGLKAIPYFQVVLSLVSDLGQNGTPEQDKRTLLTLLNNMLAMLEPLRSAPSSMLERNASNEIRLIVMRALSVLLSKSKYQRDGINFIIEHVVESLNHFHIIDACLQSAKLLFSQWKSQSTENQSGNSNSIADGILNISLNNSNNYNNNNTQCLIRNGYLMRTEADPKYLDEMAPFFVRADTPAPPQLPSQPNQQQQQQQHQSSSTTGADIHQSYQQLLTETVIRLPYQMRKLAELRQYFDFYAWTFYLCEYLMQPQCHFLKRLIKKLLQLLCGSKDKYRRYKDHHIIMSSLREIVHMCPLQSAPIRLDAHKQYRALDQMNSKTFSYDNLLILMEHLKVISDIALTRTLNWQQYCYENTATLSYLIEVSQLVDEAVIPTLLQLLLCAFGGFKSAQKINPAAQQSQQPQQKSKTASKSSLKASSNTTTPTDENHLNIALIDSLFKTVPRGLLTRFIRAYLLECPGAHIRWLMHSLVYNMYKHASPVNADTLFELLLDLWYQVPTYGTKAAQFVDLIGYVVIKSSATHPTRTKHFFQCVIELFHAQNLQLATHANSSLYNTLASLVEFDGFYLESEPCFICNQPESTLATLKLNAIKVDSRFTTNTQYSKLISSHSISKIHIKISDIKKTKMVSTLTIYYNNKSVASIVDLKSLPKSSWLKAKRIQLQPAQSEIKIDFTLPIVACNLKIEYTDFYENVQVATETLQCPRCSATVPANPGVCGNCGENVFQCHKCRSINYDERDPFLCNACGFCKFAKFEYTVVAKPCSDVDPIETEDDRKKTMQTMSTLMEKADKIYRTLSGHTKPALEALLIKMNEQYVHERLISTAPISTNDPQTSNAPGTFSSYRAFPYTTTTTTTAGGSTQSVIQQTTAPAHVNKTIQLIAHKYTSECKATFDELSKIIQKVNLCRRELKEYDKQFKIGSQAESSTSEAAKRVYSQTTCYGCSFACVEHCVTLLRALLCASSSNGSESNWRLKSELCKQGLVEQLINFNLKRCLNIVNSTPNFASGITATPNPSNAQQQQSTRCYGRDCINLIYLLIKDNPEGSARFNRLMLDKIESFLSPGNTLSSLAINANQSSLRHEMLLLSALLQRQEDTCWEMRLRLLMQILLRSLGAAYPKTCDSANGANGRNPVIIDCITLPCLRILNYVCKFAASNALSTLLNNSISGSKLTSAKLKSFNPSAVKPSGDILARHLSEPAHSLDFSPIYSCSSSIQLNPSEFLVNSSTSYFDKWLRMNMHMNETSVAYNERTSLIRRYFNEWRSRTITKRACQSVTELDSPYKYELSVKWLKSVLFCASSKAVRQISANIIQTLFQLWTNCSASAGDDTIFGFKKLGLAQLLAHTCLGEITSAGENFAEFLALFKTLVANDRECKLRLVLRGKILKRIESLLLGEIRSLSDLERNESSATNLTVGYSIKSLTELMSIFVKESAIKNRYKSSLVATVLNSYLSLKKLVFQRTKLVEEAQEKLLSALEEMTSGTVTESRKFMSICVETVNKFESDDLVTPVFLFERICNIILPEDSNDNKEFFMILEKDPNQEDYLQGRMLGNPYSSNDPALGPLMRNIKNKICSDCELIALLDDDNGMELLVNNKIISLDLPVKDVYKKVWQADVANDAEPMKIVYRMTGLLGDATEDIVDSLDAKNKDEEKNDEDVYKMADELARNGALAVMLQRLGTISAQNFTLAKPLLAVLLKLFGYALKLSVNRREIIKPELSAVKSMLYTLNLILTIEKNEPNKVGVALTEQLLSILECILIEASKLPADEFNRFALTFGDTEQLEFLLSNIKGFFVHSHQNLLQALMRIIPFLSFGHAGKMKALIEYFRPYYSGFENYDHVTLTPNGFNEESVHLECFCVIVNGIDSGENGRRLRDMMFEAGVVSNAVQYLLARSPTITTFLNSDYDKWKDFLGMNSLPFALRILTGLSRCHEKTQEYVGAACVPLLHKLEQFSSGSARIGVLAEDLLVLLKENPNVAKAIEDVQTQTKSEKKKLAMAMRSKQLSQLGMRANEKGQLIADSKSVKVMDESVIEEEKGHTCRICREGYKYHPQKVLSIYTFSKKVDIEPYELKARKSTGYSTVTHFNLVHIDCHATAIRVNRNNRDEWENATLLNANTKCNSLLPIWGPDVPEAVFSNALARHANYLFENAEIRETTYTLSVHDLKLLLLRFAENLSFSEDTGGGGRESNICLVPYIMHMILYPINTAKYVNREEKNLNNFLESSDRCVANAFECDNVYYYMAMALVVMKPENWSINKVKFLQRLILTTQARISNVTSDKIKLITDKLQDFKKYKPAILYFGMVNLFFENFHKKVNKNENNTWTESLAYYIRANDAQVVETCKEILKVYEEELSVCEDWVEIMDVLGMLNTFSDPVTQFTNYLATFK